MCGVWEAEVCCARGIFCEVYGVATPFRGLMNVFAQ